MKKAFLCLFWLGLLAIAVSSSAQHAGDVEFFYQNSSIVFNTGQFGFADGKRVFEAEFGAPGSGLLDGFTDEPGFISETDVNLGIGANDVIDYEILMGRFGFFLNYWNPVTSMVQSTTSTITIDDKPTGSWVVGANSGGGTGPGIIGQADSMGDFHHHIDFTLSPGSDPGIYAMLMRLNTSATGIGDSDPFWVVWNYGASEQDHERSVAFFAAVPEPTTLPILALSGLLVLRRRRHVSTSC